MVSVESFVHGRKDVLVATDIASKGLDFPNIQHVINYDMPDDIENYGRSRCSLPVYTSPHCKIRSSAAADGPHAITDHTVRCVSRNLVSSCTTVGKCWTPLA